MALSAAEKQRRYRQRRDADPQRRQEYLRKERLKYQDDLKKGKRKHIAQLSERGKRSLRKKWRKEKRQLKERRKLVENIITPPQSPDQVPRHNPVVGASGSQESSSHQNRRKAKAATKAYREIAEKTAKIKVLTKKVEMYRKRLSRCKEKQKPACKENTPQKQTRNVMGQSKKNIRKALYFHHSLLSQLKEDQKKGEKYVRSLLTGHILKKYKIKTFAMKIINAHRKRESRKKGTLTERLKATVLNFYLRDDVSRLIPGIKSTLTRNGIKKQKRLLLDTLKNLHHKYQAENRKYGISYTVFCRMRPFWVVIPTEKDRDTCLCKLCDNGRLLAEGLSKTKVLQSADLLELAKQTVCSVHEKDCMYGVCKKCKTTELIPLNTKQNLDVQATWKEWTTRKEKRTFKSGETKEVTLVMKRDVTGTLRSQLKAMNEYLKPRLTTHLFNIYNQFQHYRTIKHTITDEECVIHIDYAENFVGKMHSEIQSMHFGASQPQITLHTGIYFIKDDAEGSTFCTLSDSLQHGPAAVWTYLRPVLAEIKSKNPNVSYIHIYSDGPVTQYKQKNNFYLLSTEIFNMGFKGASWNFQAAGHGKGIPDAVGGSLKRTANQRVMCGDDIMNSNQFKEALDKTESKIKLFITSTREVQDAEEKLDRVKKHLKPIPSTLKLHQIQTVLPGQLRYQDVSCICTDENTCNGHSFKQFSFPLCDIMKQAQKNKQKHFLHKQSKESPKVKNKENLKQNPFPKLSNMKVEESGEHEGSAVEREITKHTSEMPASLCIDENYYHQCLTELQSCKTYEEFKQKCESFGNDQGIVGQRRNILECKCTVDQHALDIYPNDVPSNQILFPVVVRADGNCLPASGSMFVYGNDNHVAELRFRIVRELVLHEEIYLDTDYLWKGTPNTEVKKISPDLRKAFVMYSEEFVPGVQLSEKNIQTIYHNEVMKISRPKSYMGIWQLFGLSSVMKMKIYSVYPKLGNSNVRKDLNRMIHPREKASEDMAVIMWSTTRSDMPIAHWVPNHFLPVLPIDVENKEGVSSMLLQRENRDIDHMDSDVIEHLPSPNETVNLLGDLVCNDADTDRLRNFDIADLLNGADVKAYKEKTSDSGDHVEGAAMERDAAMNSDHVNLIDGAYVEGDTDKSDDVEHGDDTNLKMDETNSGDADLKENADVKAEKDTDADVEYAAIEEKMDMDNVNLIEGAYFEADTEKSDEVEHGDDTNLKINETNSGDIDIKENANVDAEKDIDAEVEHASIETDKKMDSDSVNPLEDAAVDADQKVISDDTGILGKKTVINVDTLHIGSHVVVTYDEVAYPGKILKINCSQKELFVECMKYINEKVYIWPRRKDRCWYTFSDVLCIIPDPVRIKNTNKYKVEL